MDDSEVIMPIVDPDLEITDKLLNNFPNIDGYLT